MVGPPTGENLTQTIGRKTDKIVFCRQAYPFHRSTSIIPNLAAYRTSLGLRNNYPYRSQIFCHNFGIILMSMGKRK